MDVKLQVEQDFTAWVNADPARVARHGQALELIREGYARTREPVIVSTYLREALLAPELPRLAFRLGNILEMLASSSSRIASEQNAILKREVQALFKNFDAGIDEQLVAVLFRFYRDHVDPAWWPETFQVVQKKYKGDFKKYARKMYSRSIFADSARLNAFIDKPVMKQLAADPCFQVGKALRDLYGRVNDQAREPGRDIDKGKRLFVDGLMQMEPGKAWAPDANSTIRLTYGKVGSYRPRDGVIYDYYTTLAGVIEKEGPAGGEFEVPAKLKELYAARDFGPYGSDHLVTCFITNNDITGGNSGSPVINANGELIGAAFDGNSEAMSGDIDFEENLQRCINVDTRYVLFVIDKIAGARHLLEEMSIVY